MNEQDNINQPAEGTDAVEAGAQNAAEAAPAEQAAAETVAVEQVDVEAAPTAQTAGEAVATEQAVACEPTQAMPATEAPQQVAQPEGQAPQQAPVGQAPTQPMPPAGQVPMQGIPVQNMAGAPAPVAQPSPTGALVCGILAIVFCWLPLVGIVLGIVAIVLAGKYFKAGGTLSQGKAGRICGIVGLVLSVVMAVISVIMMFTMLAVLDDYDTSNQYTSSTTTPLSGSFASPDALSERLDDELYDVVDPELDKIKNADAAMVQAIAAIIQESLDDDLASENVSFADLGIDSTELAKAMIQGFDYEYDFTDIDGDEGEAWYTVTCKDAYSVSSEFQTQVSELLLGDTSQYTSMEAIYAAIGQALMAAVNETPASSDEMFAVDLTKVGDKWVIDQESWDDEMDYLFGF